MNLSDEVREMLRAETERIERPVGNETRRRLAIENVRARLIAEVDEAEIVVARVRVEDSDEGYRVLSMSTARLAVFTALFGSGT